MIAEKRAVDVDYVCSMLADRPVMNPQQIGEQNLKDHEERGAPLIDVRTSLREGCKRLKICFDPMGGKYELRGGSG
ncbi:hypothetical protein CMI47_17485 [Candidatus Pacearchaeota archaeon]|nr:hypothetical protein [Candidatus Pacearchaeota archaeon]|tara:strand:+ start:10297 stop:10524 length:228 start_codon:yes stop_codon:yes gene_type:complete